jgi:hypothetical protein
LISAIAVGCGDDPEIAAAARMLVRLQKLSRDLSRMDDKKRNVLLAMAQKVSQNQTAESVEL